MLYIHDCNCQRKVPKSDNNLTYETKSRSPQNQRQFGNSRKDWTVFWPYIRGTIRREKNEVYQNKNKAGKKSKDLPSETVDIEVISWDFMNALDEKVTSYSLSNPDIYEDLLWEYSEIRDGSGALAFVSKRGFPGNESDLPKKIWSIADLVDSARYLRWLMKLAEYIEMGNIEVLKRCVDVKESPLYPSLLDVTVFDFADEAKNAFISQVNDEYCLPIRCKQEPLSFVAEEWEKAGNERYLYAAQDYLQNSVNRLIAGIQPVLTWKKFIDGNWFLGDSVAINTPWQAICYGLFLHVTNRGNLHACRGCGNFIKGRKIFCDNTCNQRFNRNNDSRVNAYPPDRKEAIKNANKRKKAKR